MSTKRPPGPPPAIAGYQYLSLLGSGGFSDVYLYQQDRPRRRVAVKVLLSDLKTAGARQRFESEANLMAALSSHPYIVTIYEADVTAAGHSYLAMEYCSRPSLDVRYRRGRLGVDEVLAIGIQVASAVETAHRAGIVHRDIKPANILVTDYNRPALTDFGISGTTDSVDEDAGMSIPWSPPEAFGAEAPDGVAMDVWALGATIYTLLAGRSPFVRPGADNSQRELMNRITHEPLPPLYRADVPESLERALATAMAKSPVGRFASAHALALALQRVQADLNLSLTPFEVLGDVGPADDGPDDGGQDATRIRRVVSIDPDAAVTAARRPVFPGRDAPAGNVQPGNVQRGNVQAGNFQRGNVQAGDMPGTGMPGRTQPGAMMPAPFQADGADDATVFRAAVPGYGPLELPRAADPDAGTTGGGDTVLVDPAPLKGRRRGKLLAAGAAALALAAVVVGIVANGVGGQEAAPDGSGEGESTGPVISQAPPNALDGLTGTVSPVQDLQGSIAAGQAGFGWRNPEPADGDQFFWRVVTATSEGRTTKTTEAAALVPLTAGERTCIEVFVVRANGTASEPVRGCAQ